MNRDKVLVDMMTRQSEAFNRNAPEWERVAIFLEIQQYQKEHRGES
jgi:hypothetical protein